VNLVFVRTKLQAIIVVQMVEAGLIQGALHVVKVREGPHDAGIQDASVQLESIARQTCRTTLLDRRHGVAFVLATLRLCFTAWLRGDRIYVANLNWLALGLALKACPGLQIHSFDDGTANLQQRDSSYRSNAATTRRGPVGWAARSIFPEGCAAFARSRIARHCTIYPGLENVAPAHRIDEVAIPWSRFLDESSRLALPSPVERIFIGSVYPAIKREPVPVTAAEVERLIDWCDLYVPHPREASAHHRSAVLARLPAESIIDHYARINTVIVAHYNSSAALPFTHDPRVRLVDLMTEEFPTLDAAGQTVDPHDDGRERT
jgi:hypothetical protein